MQPLSNSKIVIHPRAEKLREQNRQLQTDSVHLIVERDHLKNVVCPQILAEYQTQIGVFELRAFQFECECRAMIRRIELAQSALNRGEKPVYQAIENEIKIEFSAWQAKIEYQAQEIKSAKELQNLPVLSSEDSRELQKIYRKLAFLLHEDIVGKTDERRQKLWLQTAEAYQNGDLQTLQILFLLVENDHPETDSSENILENLEKRNAELKQTCENFLDKISEIKNTTPYILQKTLDNTAEVLRIQNELSEQIEILREKRRQLVEHWAEIMHFAEDAENIRIPAGPPDIFNEENDDWAEIIFD